MNIYRWNGTQWALVDTQPSFGVRGVESESREIFRVSVDNLGSLRDYRFGEPLALLFDTPLAPSPGAAQTKMPGFDSDHAALEDWELGVYEMIAQVHNTRQRRLSHE
jgi:hypothetical protein